MEQPASNRLRRDRVRSGAKSRLEITLFPVIILRYASPAPSKAPQPEPPPLPTFSPGALIDLSPAEWTAIWLSLKIATVATLVSLPFGVFTAYALARNLRRLRAERGDSPCDEGGSARQERAAKDHSTVHH